MSGAVVDLASRRPGARILILPREREVEVVLDPPADRPGCCGGKFETFKPARVHAQAMQILLGRPIEIVWGTGHDGPEAA